MRNKLTGILVLAFLLLVSAAQVDAQKIKKWVIGSGGVVMAPATDGSTMSGVLGQLVIGRHDQTTQVAYYGFWTPEELTPVEEPGKLSQYLKNYPNPFNASTTIEYQLPATSFVTIKVYDTRGNLVRTLLTGTMQDSGAKTLSMDARDDNGTELASGSYIYEVSAKPAQLAGAAGGETKVMRNIMVIVK